VRVSTDKQAEFGMSLEAQTAELQRYCAERNWAVVETFVDAGFSGKDTGRSAFQRMIVSSL
jgi:site-specific DNA recombinase